PALFSPIVKRPLLTTSWIACNSSSPHVELAKGCLEFWASLDNVVIYHRPIQGDIRVRHAVGVRGSIQGTFSLALSCDPCIETKRSSGERARSLWTSGSDRFP